MYWRLKLAAELYSDAVVSVGVDTWGVDYALFDKDGRILGSLPIP